MTDHDHRHHDDDALFAASLAPTLRVASWIVVVWFPLFAILFFGVLPILGLDLSRFGDPAVTLPFFATYPVLIRLLFVGNIVTIVAAGVVLLGVAWGGRARAPQRSLLAALLGSVGWFLYLLGEIADATAYVWLPFTYTSATPSATLSATTAAETAFVTMQTFGRSAHTFGYVALGLAFMLLTGVLRTLSLRRRWLTTTGTVVALAGTALGAVELFVVSQRGDAGASGVVFSALFVAFGLGLVGWHIGILRELRK
ncbi:MAG: hypothetical protein U5L04_00045 [Trueperaceae bacterium]|nr:hypothetical protein [Trueperaceae bacterium]